MKSFYRLLKIKGYTPKQFANIVGVTISTVSYWNSGDRMPSMDKFAKIILILDLKDEQVVALINDFTTISKVTREGYNE